MSERLDEKGPYVADDLPYMVFHCPSCDFPICEWTKCPDCGWYDDDRWEVTMKHYDECEKCSQTIGGGKLCDSCDTVEIEPAQS